MFRGREETRPSLSLSLHAISFFVLSPSFPLPNRGCPSLSGPYTCYRIILPLQSLMFGPSVLGCLSVSPTPSGQSVRSGRYCLSGPSFQRHRRSGRRFSGHSCRFSAVSLFWLLSSRFSGRSDCSCPVTLRPIRPLELLSGRLHLRCCLARTTMSFRLYPSGSFRFFFPFLLSGPFHHRVYVFFSSPHLWFFCITSSRLTSPFLAMSCRCLCLRLGLPVASVVVCRPPISSDRLSDLVRSFVFLAVSVWLAVAFRDFVSGSAILHCPWSLCDISIAVDIHVSVCPVVFFFVRCLRPCLSGAVGFSGRRCLVCVCISSLSSMVLRC